LTLCLGNFALKKAARPVDLTSGDIDINFSSDIGVDSSFVSVLTIFITPMWFPFSVIFFYSLLDIDMRLDMCLLSTLMIVLHFQKRAALRARGLDDEVMYVL
jgi:hypothetical protein